MSMPTMSGVRALQLLPLQTPADQLGNLSPLSCHFQGCRGSTGSPGMRQRQGLRSTCGCCASWSRQSWVSRTRFGSCDASLFCACQGQRLCSCTPGANHPTMGPSLSMKMPTVTVTALSIPPLHCSDHLFPV